MTKKSYTSDEMMTIAAARCLKDNQVCFVGIGLPSEAANLARLTNTPNIVLIYESGTLATKPRILPLSIGDGELSERALTNVSVPEMFRYWLQGGHIQIGFLGAAQIDRFANINTTVIGEYTNPKVRLPGGGGAPEIASSCDETIIILRHTTRSLVNKVDFITSFGYGDGGDHRSKLGIHTLGPTRVITDLCVLEPHNDTRELTVTALHPGISPQKVLESTGWKMQFADDLDVTRAPDISELATLRKLKNLRSHGV